VQIYHEECASAADLAIEVPAVLDDVLLDNIMFSDSHLVQESLNVLMIHKSKAYQMIEVASKLQLLHPLQQIKYQEMSAILTEVKSKVEKFEIWQELLTATELQQGQRLLELITALLRFVRTTSDESTLSIKSEYTPDQEAQQLLVNLNSIPVLVLLQDTLLDGGNETPKPIVLDILKMSNSLLCWMIKGNKSIQEQAFVYLHSFVEKINAEIDIGSSKVAEAVLEGNSELILLCPKKYISDMVGKICKQGFHPCFLDIIVGMLQLTKQQDMRVASVEREVSRFFTGTEWKNQLLLWSATSDPVGFRNRQQEMEQVTSIQAASASVSGKVHKPPLVEEAMTPNLRYYVRSLTILTCCHLGPKLQALVPPEDVMTCILDPKTVYPVRKELGEMLLEMLTQGIALIEYSDSFWKLLESFVIELTDYGTKHSHLFADSGPETATARIQLGEWLEIMLKICIVFFADFEFSSYQVEEVDPNTSEIAFRVTTRTKEEIYDLHAALFTEIKSNLVNNQHRLGRRLRTLHRSTLETMFVHNNTLSISNLPAEIGRRSKKDKRMDKASILDKQHQKYRALFRRFVDIIKTSDQVFLGISEMVSLLEKIPLIKEPVECDFRFEHFIRKVSYHIRVQMKKLNTGRNVDRKSVDTFVWLLQCMRGLLEKSAGVTVASNGDVPKYTNPVNEAQLIEYQDIYNDAGVTFMCLDLICSGTPKPLLVESLKLLSMILWRHGNNLSAAKSIFKYLKDSDSIFFFEQVDTIISELNHWVARDGDVEKAADDGGMAGILHNAVGSTKSGKSKSIKDNSNADNSVEPVGSEPSHTDHTGGGDPLKYQASSVHDHGGKEISKFTMAGIDDSNLNLDPDSMNNSYRGTSKSSKSGSSGPSGANRVKSLPPEFSVFTFLGLLCEGDSVFVKDILRDQDNNTRSANLFESMAILLDEISKHKQTPNLTKAAIRILSAIVKLIRGPCFGNQERFILHTELINSFNRFMRQAKPSLTDVDSKVYDNFGSYNYYADVLTAWGNDVDTLRELIVYVLMAGIEGRSVDSVVFERVATTVELSLFTVQLLPADEFEDDEVMEIYAFDNTVYPPCTQKYLVFLRYLSDYAELNNPSSTNASIIPSYVSAYVKREIVSVAVQTSPGNVETIHFLKPDIVRELPAARIKQLTSEIDSTSQDVELKEFMTNCRNLYREARHQQDISHYGFHNIMGFMLRLRWIMFFNAMLINILIMAYYQVVTKEDVLLEYAHRYLSQSLAVLYASIQSASTSSGDDTTAASAIEEYYMSSGPDEVVLVLNIVQVLFASATAVIYAVVTVPVLFASQREQGKSIIDAIWKACTHDYNTMWYFVNLVFALLGLTVNRLFLSIMLLDLANLDSSVMYLLVAVRNPFRQLVATMIMLCILMYIFSGLVFYFYLEDIERSGIDSLWALFKLSLEEGTRGEYGLSTQMRNTLGTRLVVDVFYYFIVSIVVLLVCWLGNVCVCVCVCVCLSLCVCVHTGNICLCLQSQILAVMREVFFAIIIDTFGQLTDRQNKRDLYANNACFICGIYRHDYEQLQTLTKSAGFVEHREVAHNIAHYLYFVMR
jgi:hypothetical protein